MKLGLISQSICSIAAAVAVASAGCSGTNNAGIAANNTPHALAVVSIGEQHTSGGSVSEPLVSAAFFSNAANIPACNTNVAGCTVAIQPICDGKTGPLCGEAQVCALDSNCKPTCETACTATCPQGEACYFPTPSTQSCQAIQTFDGGDLVFSGPGLASAFTLFPPEYSFSGNQGNPLVPGGQIQVTSEGSSGAGFAAFQESFSATTLVQTVPSLSTLTSASVFSPQGLVLGWQAGSDAIAITVSGPSGGALCSAPDTGTFTVPALVISTVAGIGNPAITVSVTRERLVQKTDGKTQGTLAGMPTAGFFDLETTSTETATIQGCGNGGEALCGAACVDVTSSNTNCGACGHACTTGTVCSEGVCTTQTTGCTSPYSACNGSCVELSSSATNCGACGFACPTGDSCVNSECTVTGTCFSPNQECSGECVNTLTSNADCGECGNACAVGTSCEEGLCTTTTTCAFTQCADGCDDTQTSNADCGECGNACTIGTSCFDGVCGTSTTCAAGETDCSSVGQGCVDTSTSNADCGTCGNACATGTSCSDGVCTGTTTTTCSTCETTAEEGDCEAQEEDCTDDANCSDYTTCVSDCAGSSTCVATCKTEYGTGVAEAEALQTCLCIDECSSSCSTTPFCTEAL